jgi:hypothetical protein
MLHAHLQFAHEAMQEIKGAQRLQQWRRRRKQ